MSTIGKQTVIETRVLVIAHEHSLWSLGDRLLVALSGGPDSVALLHVLAGLAGREGIELRAAHMNYGLRGSESDSDEQFCRTLCSSLNIPFEVARPAAPPSYNVQAWARQERQRAFRELAAANACRRIATGHTTNDKAETLVLQWMRGAARRGAGNMRPKSGPWIRPLLTTTRPEIEAYLTSAGIACRTDSSNLTARYRRNRVRHEVLPLLSDVFGMDAVAALSASADQYAIEADFLDLETARYVDLIEPAPGGLKLPLTPLSSLHPALVLQVLKHALAQLEVHPRRDRLFRLLALTTAPTGRRLRLGTHVSGEKGRDHLWLYSASATPPEVGIQIPGITQLPDGSRLCVEPLAPRPPFPSGDYRMAASIRSDANLHVRPARPGDRFRPFGAPGSRLVFDVLSEAGVPRYLRSRSWVLEDQSRILWLLGYRPAEETRVLPDSGEVYQFRWDSPGPDLPK